MTGHATLHSLARSYRRRRALAAVLLGGALIAVAMSIGFRFSPAPAGTAALATFLTVLLASLVYVISRGRVDARQIARHADRTDPAIGESAELLLAREDALSIPERLARRQAERAIARSEWRVGDLPDRTVVVMIGTGLGLLAVAGLIAFAPRGTAGLAREARVQTATSPARITSVRIAVEPPSYLRAPSRTQETWDLDVPEGAVIRWSVRLSHAIQQPAVIITSRGDTAALDKSSDDRTLRGTLRARESAIYRLAYAGGGSDFHRITVRPDARPAVTVLRPAPRTVIPPGGSRVVPLDVLVRDDHGVTAAGIVATVTSGSGESVRFRERLLALPARRQTPDGARFSATLDLDTLGMAPGDELYFHVLARDNREPSNEGRSETVFLALADTAQRSVAEFTGLALGTGPEYFRSQRQIIMDTEKLIADASRLPLTIFRERANGIGIDQGLLRLRYGEFTGEEFEASAIPDAAHEHDDPENATLLDPGTKATLKGAIAEMWQAELRLRTYRPREALPYEYRALELLKSVQQAARAYVQRAGFEPPPLEPNEKRLTGKLGAIRGATLRRTATRAEDFEAARTALRRIREFRHGQRAPADFHRTLEAAVGEISAATIAAQEPRLAALRELRALADSHRAGRPCVSCAARAEAALVAALPEPTEAPALPPTAGDLRKRYLQLLRRP